MNPYLAFSFVLLGIVIVLTTRTPVRKLTDWFKERAPLVKRYWLFVIPFLILNAAGYIIVAIWFNSDTNFSIFGQISATIFAIFVGYIAFSEFGESKFEKLLESASMSLNRREFNSARMKYEEANAIKPKDADVIANLLEIYLILGMYDKFDGKEKSYMKYSVEDKNEIIHLFLLSLRSLVVEHMRDAKDKIKETIDLVDQKPAIREGFYWSIDEFISSDAYRVLDITTQKVISNYFAFLKRHLTNNQEQRFIEGSYENVEDSPPETTPLNLRVDTT